MRIQPKPIAGLILNPFGVYARAIVFKDRRLCIRSRRRRDIHLGNLAEAPALTGGILGTTLVFHSDDGDTYRLKGARYEQALAFAEAVRTSWCDYHSSLFATEAPVIKALLRVIADLSAPACYPSACILSPALEQARELEKRLLSRLPRAALGADSQAQVQAIQDFVSHAYAMRDAAIARFEARQLVEWEHFFDTFESKPLTPEQRTSIVADEDATLVLAGAGSGKTSVITAKAGYLLESETRRAEEILLLAFAKEAAREMSERIEEKCGETLQAKTFHSLAYDIIGAVEGSKPALAPHATDEKTFLALIRDILRALVQTTREVSSAIIGWFSYARFEDKSQWDFKKKHDYYTYIEKADLRSLQGEQVKSVEELMIANWLFENGIEYEYEPDYEYSVAGPGYRDYCPDFRLTKSGVYIEHFGVRHEKSANGAVQLTTAPFVSRKKYLDDMEWKRSVHKNKGTTLIETFSYEREEGRLLEALADKIAPYETLSPRPRETLFDAVAALGQVDGFVRLIGTFLRHYKGGGYQLHKCAEKGEGLGLGKRASAFLSIFAPVYGEYQRRLGGRIDFEDMILRACEYTESGQYQSPFKHILVDEFQDISSSRGRLVKALKAQHLDARLFAVGDDWQSIYRFAGSDVNLMRNFGEEFGGVFNGQTAVHRRVDLGRTFRSVDQIAHAAKRFVLQNPAQLNKAMIPAGAAQLPALRFVSTWHDYAGQKLAQVLHALPEQPGAERNTRVLLLGRYRHLKPAELPRLRLEFPHLDLVFKTIHAAKGLEAEHVIVLGLSRGRMGFPSEVVDDPLLSLVSPAAEPFENAEERRVMYVALTRARRTVTMMGPASRQSAFVTELLDDSEYAVIGDATSQRSVHKCGECGGRLLALPTRDGRIWYRCEHRLLCGHSMNPCPECGTGLPQKQADSDLMLCACGAKYPACPKCKDGWLIERGGPYGRFLGCIHFPGCRGKQKVS